MIVRKVKVFELFEVSKLTALQSRSELTDGLEQVQVVATDVVLRQVNDRHHQRLLNQKTGKRNK